MCCKMSLMSIFLFCFCVAGLFVTWRVMCSSQQLSVGDKAPDFALKDQDGKVHTLQDYAGKKVVLYFYPMDSTPGCTTQACSLKDGYAELEKEGITVLGLSGGSLSKKKKFATDYNLPFSLLHASKSVLSSYHAKGIFFISRITYLINEEGIIIDIINNIDLKNHAKQVINRFKSASHSSAERMRLSSQEQNDSAVVYLHTMDAQKTPVDKRLHNIVAESKKLVMIFYEDWCNPCKKMTPIFDQLSHEYSDVLFIKVKRELYPTIFDQYVTQQFHTKTVPAILLFNDGVCVEKQLISTTEDGMKSLLERVFK